MYRRGLSCHSCHEVHGTENPAQLRSPVAELCLDCHMPQIEVTIANVHVRAHTFEFITPGLTDQYQIPNPCTDCHKDKSTGWAQKVLSHWPERSPWRAR